MVKISRHIFTGRLLLKWGELKRSWCLSLVLRVYCKAHYINKVFVCIISSVLHCVFTFVCCTYSTKIQWNCFSHQIFHVILAYHFDKCVFNTLFHQMEKILLSWQERWGFIKSFLKQMNSHQLHRTQSLSSVNPWSSSKSVTSTYT